ncbi:MAG: response regulator [Anaerolineae bacterium]|nr:response regulator [Anaerolineae bacterium]
MAIKTLIIAETRICDSLLVVLHSMSEIASVDTAEEIELGLMMSRENQPALVFLDAGLAKQKTTELIQQMKNENPSARLIALIDSIEQRRQVLEAGASEVLIKGFSMAQLSELIRRLQEEHLENASLRQKH